MTETMPLRELIAFMNGAQSNVQFGIKRIFQVPGRVWGGTYITCGDDEYPLATGRKGDGALIDVAEVASMLRHFGQEHMLMVLFPDLADDDSD